MSIRISDLPPGSTLYPRIYLDGIHFPNCLHLVNSNLSDVYDKLIIICVPDDAVMITQELL